MLTEAQVAKARTFPGCSDITAETAVDKLFAAAEVLQQSAATAGGSDKHALAMKVASLETQLTEAKAQIPQQMPASVLRAMAHAARTHMKAAVKSQAITPVVAEMLAARLIGTDDAPSPTGLTPSASGECIATAVFEALSGNGPAPSVLNKDNENQSYTGAQPAPKTQHGAPESKAPDAERIKSLMEMTPLGQAAMNNSNGNGRR